MILFFYILKICKQTQNQEVYICGSLQLLMQSPHRRRVFLAERSAADGPPPKQFDFLVNFSEKSEFSGRNFGSWTKVFGVRMARRARKRCREWRTLCKCRRTASLWRRLSITQIQFFLTFFFPLCQQLCLTNRNLTLLSCCRDPKFYTYVGTCLQSLQ